MSLQKNVSEAMRLLKAQRNLSMTEFSAELDVSKATLQTYLNGTGNPSLGMVEHMAEQLGIDPMFLLAGGGSGGPFQAYYYFSGLLCILKELPDEKRRKFEVLFHQILALWEDEI